MSDSENWDDTAVEVPDAGDSTPEYAMDPIIGDGDVYGELILLGYNGCPESRIGVQSKRHQTKIVLRRREKPNGVKKGTVQVLSGLAKDNHAYKDKKRYMVWYQYTKDENILVDYEHDPTKDMFQIGRSSEPQIDFTVVDTWLASPPSGSSDAQPMKPMDHGKGAVSSTISRYACRLLIDRENGNKAYVSAAGFDSGRNIVLGEKATKWSKASNQVDGLTTNGVLILHPNRMLDDLENEDGSKPMYVWREVSVDGDIFTVRDTRSSSRRGDYVPEETNMLQDGSLIDLCGATVLWRTADGLERSPKASELEMALGRLNAGKPQCPVNLNTLMIPKKRSSRGASSRQAYVYLRCGHVQGKHNWKTHSTASGQLGGKCPICMVESERIIQLTMGMESSFHLDSGNLDHAFNPCGHVASKNTTMYWSRIPLPQGTNSFCPVCPFCTALLATEKPYVRLIFQDHVDDL